MILFSIIVPTYNRAHLIGETIQSILDQEYTYFELIIVDDGSSDDTEEVVKTFLDSRIIYYKKRNEERGAARNFGLRHAKGTYALFFDSDDWMHKDHLSTLYKYLQAAPSTYNFIATKYQLKEENDHISSGGSQSLNEGWYKLSSVLKGNMFGCLYAVKTSNPDLCLFEEDRSYAALEDWMFLLQNLQDDALFLIDKVTITVRNHDNRSMANNGKVIKARQKATDWALGKVHLSNSDQKKLKAYSSYFCAIHYYIDENKHLAKKELKEAIKDGGFKLEFFILLFKIVIGKQWVQKMK